MNGELQAKKFELKQELLMPLMLLFLFTTSAAMWICGVSFVSEPLDMVQVFLRYLLPIGFYYSLRNTPWFPFRNTVQKLSFATSLLCIIGLMVNIWGGELNPNFRRSRTSAEEGSSYRSAVNTWHTILQKDYFRSKDLTILLEAITEADLRGDVRTLRLSYDRTVFGFLRQSKQVCKLTGLSNAQFTINQE